MLVNILLIKTLTYELTQEHMVMQEAMQEHKTAFEEMKMNLIHGGLDEQSAEEKAYSNVLPMLQKELESIYMERLLWITQLDNDPVHKK